MVQSQQNSPISSEQQAIELKVDSETTSNKGEEEKFSNARSSGNKFENPTTYPMRYEPQ